MRTVAPSVPDDEVPGRGRPPWVRPIAVIALATLGLWLISATAMLIYTRDAREPVVRTVVIPDGTSRLIAAGENPLEIPATWSFRADDTLELVNQDTVDHWVGNFFVEAGTSRDYILQPAISGSLLCSLHPSGNVAIDVALRDFDWRLPMVPTLAFGPAIGLVILGVGRVMRAIDEEPA